MIKSAYNDQLSPANSEEKEDTVNSGLQSSQPRKSSTDITESAYNEQPSPAPSEEEEEFRSGKCLKYSAWSLNLYSYT